MRNQKTRVAVHKHCGNKNIKVYWGIAGGKKGGQKNEGENTNELRVNLRGGGKPKKGRRWGPLRKKGLYPKPLLQRVLKRNW